MTYTQKQLNYYKRWEGTRQHKWTFITKHGLLYWALPLALFSVFFDWTHQAFNYSHALVITFTEQFLVAGIVGLVASFFTFKRSEKEYKNVKHQSLL